STTSSTPPGQRQQSAAVSDLAEDSEAPPGTHRQHPIYHRRSDGPICVPEPKGRTPDSLRSALSPAQASAQTTRGRVVRSDQTVAPALSEAHDCRLSAEVRRGGGDH